MLPDWYTEMPSAAAPEPVRTGRRAGRAVRRALASLGETMAREMAGPQARPDSCLGRVDAHSKVAGAIVLIVAATFVHRLPVLAMMLMGAVVLVLANGVGARRLGRIWLGVPLFSLAMILPASLNVVTDGAPLLTLWCPGPGAHLGLWELPATMTITRPGVAVAARFLLRVLTCVTLAFLLVATTGPDELLHALRRLGMPRAFAMVLTMMHRYIVVLLRAAQEIHLAKLSRSMGGGSLVGEQHWVAAGVGSLFRRTRHLADEVHEAMLSRGYDGDLQVAARPRWRIRDGLLVIVALLFSAALLLANRLL